MRSRISFFTLLTLTLVLAGPGITASCFASSHEAALSGVVRDVHGIPQTGAVVQLFNCGAQAIQSVLTDDLGRYSIPSVRPGCYQLRATAAFFLPTPKENVKLMAGAQAIVNLTLSTMAEAASWLPAQRRRADESADDWKWALRSSANRPLLRIVDEDDPTAMVSSSAERNHRAKTHTSLTVTSGDGGFGQGGVHQVILLDRSLTNGDGTVFRADISGSRSPYPVAPSTEVVIGYERRSAFGGNTRLVSSFQSHPELTNGTNAGVQVMRIASTQEYKFGDTIVLDAGSLLRAERMALTRLSAEPFARLTMRPMSGLLMEYRFASGQELQSSEDLDRLKPALRVLTDATGKPLSTNGTHNEVSLSRKMGSSVVQVSAYKDHLDNVAINGTGVLDAKQLVALGGIVADPTTGRFALSSANFSGDGMSVSVTQPLTPSLSAWFGYDLGTALVAAGGDPVPLADAINNLQKRATYAATASLRGKVNRTGTNVRAEYRWQPVHTMTAINSFNAPEQGAYLGIYVRQRLWGGRLIPDGIDAVIEATNLLEQGYQPVVASDGRLMFLAQAPRAIQAGLAFNF